jgi:DNA-binding MarR family transcriptional regulator
VTKREYETLAAFRYELRKFLHFSEQAAEANGLATQQYLALLAIEGFPGRNRITIGELAERLQIVSHSAVGLVDRLENAGLVRRRPADDDRRKVVVQLTARGRRKLEKLARVHREELRTAGPLLADLLKNISKLSPPKTR